MRFQTCECRSLIPKIKPNVCTCRGSEFAASVMRRYGSGIQKEEVKKLKPSTRYRANKPAATMYLFVESPQTRSAHSAMFWESWESGWYVNAKSWLDTEAPDKAARRNPGRGPPDATRCKNTRKCASLSVSLGEVAQLHNGATSLQRRSNPHLHVYDVVEYTCDLQPSHATLSTPFALWII